MNANLSRPLPFGIGHVSQLFGEHPDWYAPFGMSGHNGIDYAAPTGTPVLACHEGIAVTGDDPGGYGVYVKVTNGYRVTIYGHLSVITIADGAQVVAGQQIGEVGSTGNSTGPHLHLGLKWVHGRNPAYRDWVDPRPFRE